MAVDRIPGRRLIGSVAVLACIAAATPARADGATVSGTGFTQIAGEYVVVSRRANSYAAAPAQPALSDADSPLGKTIIVHEAGLSVDGISCEDWQIANIDPPSDFKIDPSLADLRVAPTRSDAVAKFPPSMPGYFRISCEGVETATVFRAGPRVLAMSWNNGTSYLVLEKPLLKVQFDALRQQLHEMKFLDDPDQADEAAVLAAARSYYEYRAGKHPQGTALRIALTHNFLAPLKVLETSPFWNTGYTVELAGLSGPWRLSASAIHCFTDPCPDQQVTDQFGRTIKIADIFGNIPNLGEWQGLRSCRLALQGRLVPGAPMRTNGGLIIGRYVSLDSGPVVPPPTALCEQQ